MPPATASSCALGILGIAGTFSALARLANPPPSLVDFLSLSFAKLPAPGLSRKSDSDRTGMSGMWSVDLLMPKAPKRVLVRARLPLPSVAGLTGREGTDMLRLGRLMVGIEEVFETSIGVPIWFLLMARFLDG